jgi:hypothetical protein
MTYLDIEKFYSKNQSGLEAQFYLKLKAKSFGGKTYKIDNWDPNNAPTSPAVSSITFNLVEAAATDTYQHVYLGNFMLDTSKDLAIVVMIDGEEKEGKNTNYRDSSPE